MDKDMFMFYKNALTNGLCEEYKNYWRGANGNKSRLVELAMIQQAIPFFATYCYKGDGLSKEYLLEEYKDYINDTTLFDCDGVHGYSYKLYVDYKSDVMPLDVDVSHFMYCNGITINVAETKCPTIYISNKSNVTICCDGYNSLRVYLFDESKVVIDNCDEDTDVVIYKYSDNCNVEKGKYCLSEKVKEFSKELRL